MHQVQVNVVSRNMGRNELRDLRKQGMVPANVYGPGVKNESCALNEKELRKAFNGDLTANLLIELKSPAGNLNGRKVVLKEISRNPLWEMEHVDLYEIDMNRPLSARVPLHFIGTPEGVKTDGGILQVIRRYINIEALPANLPDFIEVDITALKLDETLHISEIKTPQNVKVKDSAEFALVSVTEPEKEEVVAPAAGDAAATAAAGEGTATATGTAAAAAAPTAAAKEEPKKK